MKAKRLSDKQLGIGPNISRRDFINTTLVGAGTALLAGSAPMLFEGCADKPALNEKDDWSGYGAVGDYATTSGNTRKVMETAHRLRDGAYNDPQLASNNYGRGV